MIIIEKNPIIKLKNGKKISENFVEAMKFHYNVEVTQENVDYLYEKYTS